MNTTTWNMSLQRVTCWHVTIGNSGSVSMSICCCGTHSMHLQLAGLPVVVDILLVIWCVLGRFPFILFLRKRKCSRFLSDARPKVGCDCLLGRKFSRSRLLRHVIASDNRCLRVYISTQGRNVASLILRAFENTMSDVGDLPVNFTDTLETLLKSELQSEKSILVVVLCLAIWQSLVSFFVFLEQGRKSMRRGRNVRRGEQC